MIHKFPIPAEGAVLAAIKERASERDLPLGRAAISLIEDGMAAEPVAMVASTLVNLEAISTDDLMDEVIGRLKSVEDAVAMLERAETAEARADAAEAKLVQVAGVLGGIGLGAAEAATYGKAG